MSYSMPSRALEWQKKVRRFIDGIGATARREGDHYVLDAEKWCLTGANKADFAFLQAKIRGGPNEGGHVLFFIDMSSPGIELVRTPAFSHNLCNPSSHLPVRCSAGAGEEPHR